MRLRFKLRWLVTSLLFVSLQTNLFAPDPMSPDLFAAAVQQHNPTRAPVLNQNQLRLNTQPMRFAHLTTEDGLSHGAIFCITQDAQGFLWFGTEDGLNRYDGYTFRIYGHDPDNPHSLSRDVIPACFTDSTGTLWVGTQGGGLNRFDPASETFTHYQHDPTDPTSLSNDGVVTIFEASDGTLWVGTSGGWLNRFHPASETFTRYLLDPASQSQNTTTAIAEDSSGTLWVGSRAGLYRFDPVSETFTAYRHDPNDPTSLSNDYVSTMSLDSSGVLWVGTQGGGLNRFDPASETFARYQHDPDDPTSLSNDGLTSIYEDRQGNLWVGSGNGGLNLLDRETGQFTRYQHNPDDSNSLSNNNVRAIYEDAAGVLWVGTQGGGLNDLNPALQHFRQYQHDPDNPNSLNHSYVISIYEDHEGMLWAGTLAPGGLNKIDRQRGIVTRYLHDPDDPTSLNSDVAIEEIYVDSQGTLWVGTWGGGLSRFDRANETFTAYMHDPTDPTSISSDMVVALEEDPQGRLWVGTWGSGLDRFDPASEQFTHYLPNPDDPTSLKNGNVSVLHPDHDDMLWVGTWGSGLSHFNPATETFTTYQYDPTDPTSLSNNSVHALHTDQQGTLWVGTNKGLNRFDPATEGFISYTRRDGLPSDVINGILEDAKGRLWLSTNKELVRFNPCTETFRAYDQADGLLSQNFNPSASFQNSTDELCFGTRDGLTVFDPATITDNPYVPPVVLTDFRLFNEPVPIAPNSLLPQAINLTDHIVLTHDDTVFSLEFAALSYTAPHKNRYRYMLEGLEEQWNEVDSTRRQATYTNLPPDTYTFRVQGSNNSDVWNNEGVVLTITVLPPWWETWLFRGSMLVLLLLAMGGAYSWRTHALAQRARDLAQQVDERTRELQQEMQERQHAEQRVIDQERAVTMLRERERLARELHDSLGQVLGYVNTQAQTMRDLITRNEPRATLPLLDHLIATVQHTSMDIRDYILGVQVGTTMQPAMPEITTTGNLGDTIVDYLTQFQQRHGIEVNLTSAPDLDGLHLSPTLELHLLRVVQEALTNVRKHAQATKVDITMHSRDDLLSVQVVDNGQGFPLVSPDDEGVVCPTGYGLTSMRGRVTDIGGTLEIETTPGEGTRVLIFVPLRRQGDVTQHALRVLLVDDNPLFLQGLHNLLTVRGFDVVGTASNGHEAQEQARTLNPDIILMDVQMPECDGLEATRAIKASMSHIQIVMLTVSDDDAHLFEAIKQGAAGYLLKSLEGEELCDMLLGLRAGEVPLSPGLAARILREFAQGEHCPSPAEETPTENPAHLAALLSEQQIELLTLLAKGLSRPEVGERLGYSVRTVSRYMGQIVETLHMSNRSGGGINLTPVPKLLSYGA